MEWDFPSFFRSPPSPHCCPPSFLPSLCQALSCSLHHLSLSLSMSHFWLCLSFKLLPGHPCPAHTTLCSQLSPLLSPQPQPRGRMLQHQDCMGPLLSPLPSRLLTLPMRRRRLEEPEEAVLALHSQSVPELGFQPRLLNSRPKDHVTLALHPLRLTGGNIAGDPGMFGE